MGIPSPFLPRGSRFFPLGSVCALHSFNRRFRRLAVFVIRLLVLPGRCHHFFLVGVSILLYFVHFSYFLLCQRVNFPARVKFFWTRYSAMRPFCTRLDAAANGEDDSNDSHTPMKTPPPRVPPNIKKERKLKLAMALKTHQLDIDNGPATPTR